MSRTKEVFPHGGSILSIGKHTVFLFQFGMDLCHLGGLFSHYRPRAIFSRIVLLSEKLIIHSATVSKFESKNSQEYHHVVCNAATNRPVEKGVLNCTGEYFKKLKFQLLENTHKCKFVIFKLKEEDRVITY